MPELGELVLDALEKAIQQDGECRLLSKGKGNPGLLPGGSLTLAKKQAKEHCLSPDLGLFSIREVEEGKGKSAGKVHFVTITRTGVALLFSRKTFAQRSDLLEKCANPHKEIALEANLKAAEQELKQIVEERERLDKRASGLRSFLKRVVEEQLTAIAESRESLDSQAKDLESLVLPPGPLEESKTEPPKPRQFEQLKPPTEEDFDFQVSLCQQLVFAWQDNPDPDVRETLELVMINNGLDPVGEVGETVEFDGREHRTEHDLRPGDRAVVIEQGWQFVTPQRTVLIAPARVELPRTSEEVPNAPHA